MNDHIFYTAGNTDALLYAAARLKEHGFQFASEPDKTVTHLLLDVPLRDDSQLAAILPHLSEDVTICGGNLQHPALVHYKTADLLKDPFYLAENAQITAHCAVKRATQLLPVILRNCHILVIGWGRIGKCLAALLQSMGAIVTVAARNPADRAIVLALGYDACDIADLSYSLLRYRVIFNTVPAAVLSEDAMDFCAPDCLKIDLASTQGMVAADVIHAKGLPGKDAPESSGQLIAQTILRLVSLRKEF